MIEGPGKRTKLDWNTRLKIAVGAAQGLAYLHQDCKPQVVHRDVKSCNILLNANMEAHLCDFGLAKNIQPSRTHTSTYVLGTIGYIDPEYAQTSRLNDKSDVYSFGIVLLELIMGKKAVDDEVNLLDWVRTHLHNTRGQSVFSRGMLLMTSVIVSSVLWKQWLTQSLKMSHDETTYNSSLLCN